MWHSGPHPQPGWGLLSHSSWRLKHTSLEQHWSVRISKVSGTHNTCEYCGDMTSHSPLKTCVGPVLIEEKHRVKVGTKEEETHWISHKQLRPWTSAWRVTQQCLFRFKKRMHALHHTNLFWCMNQLLSKIREYFGGPCRRTHCTKVVEDNSQKLGCGILKVRDDTRSLLHIMFVE